MRLVEFINEQTNDLGELAEACENWVEMWNTKNSINTILSHPLSQRCKNSNASIIYRSVFVNEEKFNKTGKVTLRAQQGGMIPYTENKNWGGSVRDDFDYNGDILEFKKNFNHGDLILNFTQLLNELEKSGFKIYTAKESELWMKAIPYYKSFNRNELIDIDKGS